MMKHKWCFLFAMDKATLFLCVVVLNYCVSFGVHEGEVKELHKKGDIILGGLFPIHKKSNVTENECGVFHLQPGYQYMIAMLFALEQINNRSDLLPNITLGTNIYDTCRSTTIGADRARDFIKKTLFAIEDPLVTVIGPFISDVSIATAPLLRVFGIPQISYGSSSPVLSNKELYSNFFRTVPPDTFQAEAIVDILEHFEWNFIAVIGSHGNYGESGISQLKTAAEKSGICIAISQSIPFMPKSSDYSRVVQEIQKDIYSKVSIIVLFTSQTDSTGLLKAAMELKADRFTWLGSSGWSNRMDVINGKEKIANGSITVNHLGGRVEGFVEYYMRSSSHSQTPWSSEFSSNCPSMARVHKCSMKYTLPNVAMSPARVVVNAVYAVAHALHDMQLTECRRQTGLCEKMVAKLRQDRLVEYLRNTTFPDAVSGKLTKFNSKQEMDGNYTIMNLQQKTKHWDYVVVGEWGVVVDNNDEVKKKFKMEVDLMTWGNSPTKPPVSACSRPCTFPLIHQSLPLHPQCCWRCVKCQDNQIIANNSCQSCQQGSRPSVNLSTCTAIELSYPSFDDHAGIACTMLTLIAVMCTLLVAIFFERHKHHPVTMAAGKELCVIILVGILLCYITIFPFLMKPSTLVCTVCRYLGSVCFTTCYAPLLMKTNRIYRIFKSGKKSVVKPSLVSPSSQVLATLGLISIQIFITTVWVISSPPTLKFHYQNFETVEVECHTQNLSLVSNLSYNVFLMVLCTAFAFKTREFPRNFNEAKYIGIMMYLICSVWIIFLPTVLNTSSPFAKVFIRITSYWLIGTTVLIGLFFPKMYVILFPLEESLNSSHNDAGCSMSKIQNSYHDHNHDNASSRSSPKPTHEDGKRSHFLRVDGALSGHVFGSDGEITERSPAVLYSGNITPSINISPST